MSPRREEDDVADIRPPPVHGNDGSNQVGTEQSTCGAVFAEHARVLDRRQDGRRGFRSGTEARAAALP